MQNVWGEVNARARFCNHCQWQCSFFVSNRFKRLYLWNYTYIVYMHKHIIYIFLCLCAIGKERNGMSEREFYIILDLSEKLQTLLTFTFCTRFSRAFCITIFCFVRRRLPCGEFQCHVRKKRRKKNTLENKQSVATAEKRICMFRIGSKPINFIVCSCIWVFVFSFIYPSIFIRSVYFDQCTYCIIPFSACCTYYTGCQWFRQWHAWARRVMYALMTLWSRSNWKLGIN